MQRFMCFLCEGIFFFSELSKMYLRFVNVIATSVFNVFRNNAKDDIFRVNIFLLTSSAQTRNDCYTNKRK